MSNFFYFLVLITICLIIYLLFIKVKKNKHIKELKKKETYINYYKAIEQEFKEKIEQKEKNG